MSHFMLFLRKNEKIREFELYTLYAVGWIQRKREKTNNSVVLKNYHRSSWSKMIKDIRKYIRIKNTKEKYRLLNIIFVCTCIPPPSVRRYNFHLSSSTKIYIINEPYLVFEKRIFKLQMKCKLIIVTHNI